MPILMTCANPPRFPPHFLTASRPIADEPKQEQTMRLSKTEWMGVAVIAGSIACFGGWLQSEMQRAALARIHRNTPDPLAACGDVSVRDAEMLGKGELWCGTIGTERVVTAQAAPSISVNDANSALRRTAVQTQ